MIVDYTNDQTEHAGIQTGEANDIVEPTVEDKGHRDVIHEGEEFA